MAKDGTRRGGARVGAGRKKKALVDKIQDGRKTTTLEFQTPDLTGEDMPPVKDYMVASQKNGEAFLAKDVYTDTWKWLQERGCENVVNPQLVQQYSMAVARWVQCENAVSEFGFLAKHPTTGAAIASPYVAMSREYLKQVNQCWFQIFQLVKENSTSDFNGKTPQDDLMERLLAGK